MISITHYKKALLIATLVAGSALPTFAQAAVTLLVDDNIKVTAINGQEIKQSAFKPLTKSFTLEPGKHVITAKYDRLFDLRRDEHDYLRSGNVSVAAELQDNQTYTLVMPGQPNDYPAAKEYAQNPTLAVRNGNNVIASQKGTSSEGSGIFGSLTKAVGGIFGSNDAQMANQQAIASLEQTGTVNNANTVAIPAIQTSTTQVVSAANNASTLDQFMQLWLKATPEERTKIRQWIKD